MENAKKSKKKYTLFTMNKNVTVKKLWEGCMLSAIDYAVGIAEYPELAYEQS